MTSVNRLHYDFIQLANRTDSEYLKSTTAVQRDFFLNKAKDNILQHYAELFEKEDIVRQYLREITVRDRVMTGQDKGERYVAIYPLDMLKPVKVYAEATKVGCLNQQRRLIIRRLPSDKIERALKNVNARRFWDFEETFGLESERGLEVYQGDTQVQRVVLDYVRKVRNVAGPEFEDAEKYISPEGNAVSGNVDLELSHPDLVSKMVSLAVLFAHQSLGNLTDFQSRYQTILNIERVFN